MRNNGTLIQLPNDIEAEQHTIGSMLTSYNAANQGCAILSDTDFFDDRHRDIFTAIRSLYLQDKAIDAYVVGRVLRDSKKDLTDYISQLTELGLISFTVDDSIDRVKEKSLLRESILACRNIEAAALSKDAKADRVLNDAGTAIFQIGSRRQHLNERSLEDIFTGKKSDSGHTLLQDIEIMQETFKIRQKSGNTCTGIPTHLIDLDRVLNGLNNSNLIIIAGRPGMGKSAFAMHIAAEVAIKQQAHVGIFSLEMSSPQLVYRLLAWHSEIDSRKIATGNITSEEFITLSTSVSELQQTCNFHFDDSGLVTVQDIRFRARRWKELYDIKLLVIDYLQLLSSSRASDGNRVQEVSEISRTLKILAKELDIPILCLSQLSRRTEQRASQKPMLSDLRESGSIEQDADSVILLFRSDYYQDSSMPVETGVAEVIVAKNRHGECKTIKTIYKKEINKFLNYTPIEKHIEAQLKEPNPWSDFE